MVFSRRSSPRLWRKSQKPVNIVSDGKSILLGASEAGDEPLLIARSLPDVPVITGAKRKLTGQEVIDRFGSQVLICDDAFQAPANLRDIDVCFCSTLKNLWATGIFCGGRAPRTDRRPYARRLLVLTRADETGPLNQDIARVASASHIPVFRPLIGSKK